MNPAQLIEIEERLKTQIDVNLLKDTGHRPRLSNWAGDLGFACDTYQVLCRVRPDLRPDTDLGLKKVFRASGLLETPNLTLMQEAGLRIVEQARSYQWTEKKISGRIDAKIAVPELSKRPIPLEHKALSPNSFRTVAKHKAEGIPLTKARYTWLKKYPGQLMVYDLMDGEEFGTWFFFEKSSGDYFFWILPLDLAYAEELVQRAERTNEAVEANRIPAPERKVECEDCDFEMTHCFPGKDFGEGYDIAIDRAELNEKAKRFLELKPMKKEFEEIDREFKELYKGKNILLADTKIFWKAYEQSLLDLPEDLRKKFTKKVSNFKMHVEALK